MPSRLRVAVILLLSMAQACSDGGAALSSGKGPQSGDALVRSEAFLDPEPQLRLATHLLGEGPKRVAGGQFAAEQVAHGDGALRSLALEGGAGLDPVWSPFIEERADAKDAPKDKNNNGTNYDETLAMLREQYVFRSNGKLPKGLTPSMLLPSLIPARLAKKPTGRKDLAGLRLTAIAGRLREATIGSQGLLIESLVMRATILLREGRGDLYGKTPEDGMLGLLLLEQAVAAESMLMHKLSYDGRTLGSFADPANYDPKTLPRIFSTRLSFELSAGGKGLPPKLQGIVVRDRGTNLRDQARLLKGFAALGKLASKQQKNPLLRRLFEGDPFGKRPGIGSTSSGNEQHKGTKGPSADDVSWDRQIKGLLGAWCSSCHTTVFKNANFSVASYESTLFGGDHRETNPTVVKGNSKASLLWQVLDRDRTPIARRMPLNSALSQVEIDLVADWIDQGALRKDPGRKEVVISPGRDGAVVVLKNLVAFHLDEDSGALVDRAYIDSRADLVRPGPAGEMLSALSAMRTALPEIQESEKLLRDYALFLARKFVAADGSVHESYILSRAEASHARAPLGAAASLMAGLLAAHDTLILSELLGSAEAIGEHLLANFVDEDGRLRNFARSEYRRITPDTLAAVLDAFAAWYRLRKTDRIKANYVRIYALHKKAGMVLAEWPDAGEAFGDGNEDSDGDRVPEVGHNMLPALFASALENRSAILGVGVPQRRVHWASDVLPVLLPHCANCHFGGNLRGDFAMDSYQDLFRGGEARDRTKIIVPGRAQESFLYLKLVRRFPPFGAQMPLEGPPLSPALREMVRQWIQQGAIRD